MSNVSDLSTEILQAIRGDLQMIGDRVQRLTERVESGFAATTQRIDALTTRVDALTDRVDTGFADVNRRLDGALAIAGQHHVELESRVRRIEDHLGLTTG